MVLPRELDPSSSVAAYFGSELRRYRTAADLSQGRLGEIINYTGALVGLVETAKRTPSRDFAERCDDALNTDGALGRLWPLVNRGNFPSWFRGYVELEATATSIATFEVQAVPGLLQTADYARAVLSAGRPGDVEEKVIARLERQHVLEQAAPPLLWAILDEALLRRPVGGTATMRAQLKRLAELAGAQRIVLQVLPFGTGEHACMDGAMTILSFAEGPDVVYLEGPGNGQLINQPEQVDQCQLRYDLVRAAALSPAASVDMICAAMEEL
ncbi:MAG TPA: helix-turn-helix transcriptional regulator [Actinocrinis sp.]|nr:helix-turn-helix transcriptional regulator [Actinocrinis sp.]